MATRAEIRRTVAKGRTGHDYGPRATRVLTTTEQLRADVQRARRYVNRSAKRKKLRGAGVAGVVAGRVGYGIVKTGAKVTGKSAKLSYRGARAAGRGYKRRVHPKVAGLARKTELAAGRGLERVLTSEAAEVARRRVIRGYARTRITRRQVAGHLHRRATKHVVARHQLSRIEEATSKAIAPRPRGTRGALARCAGCGGGFRTAAQVAAHQCGAATRAEDAAIRRARTRVAGHNRPEPTPRNTHPQSGGGTRMIGKTKAVGWDQWRPEGAADFIQQHRDAARDMSSLSIALAELIGHLDHELHMDEKVLRIIETKKTLIEQIRQLDKDIAKEFSQVYADELKKSGGGPRKILDPNFFNA